MKKIYAISVTEPNKTTGNHCVSPSDWRLRTSSPIHFHMNNGHVLQLSGKAVSDYITEHKKQCMKYKFVDAVDKTTCETVTKRVCFALIPDVFIWENGKRVNL